MAASDMQMGPVIVAGKGVGGPVPQPSPNSARPEALPEKAGRGALEGVDYKQIELIKQNLAPLSQSALDQYFKDRGLSADEVAATQELVDAVRQSEGVTPKQDPTAGDYAKVGAQVAGQVAKTVAEAPGKMLGEAMSRPEEAAKGLARFLLEAGVGMAADVPALTAGALTATIPAVGPAMAPLVAGGVGAFAAEPIENNIRRALGMPENKYDAVQRSMAYLGGVMGALDAPIKSLLAGTIESDRPFREGAVSGLQTIQEGISSLAKKLGESDGLTGPALEAAANQIDETLMDRFNYSLSKMTPDSFGKYSARQQAEAFGNALAEVPLLMEAKSAVQDFKRVMFEVSGDRAEAMSRGRTAKEKAAAATKEAGKGPSSGFSGIQARTKQAQNDAEKFAVDEIGGEIEKNKKLGLWIADLNVPTIELKKSFEEAINQFSPFLTSPNGDNVIFSNGRWFLKEKGKNGRIYEPTEQALSKIRDAEKANPVMSSLISEYDRLAGLALEPQKKSMFIGGEQETMFNIEQDLSIPLDQLIKFKQNIGKQLSQMSSGAEEKAAKVAYSLVAQAQDSALEKVAKNADNPRVAFAAQNYLDQSKVSKAAASLFDEGKILSIARLNDMPSTTARVFTDEMDISDVKRFVAICKDELIGAGMLGEGKVPVSSVPHIIGTKILQDKFDILYSKIAPTSGVLTRDAIAKLSTVYDDIMKDKRLVQKLEVLIGPEKFQSEMLKIKKASKITTEFHLALQNVSKLPSDKAAKAAENLKKAFYTRAADILTSAAVGGVPGASRSSWGIVKGLFETLGDRDINSLITKTLMLDLKGLALPLVNNVGDAVKLRSQIAEQAASLSGNPMRILGVYDALVEQKLKAIRDNYTRSANRRWAVASAGKSAYDMAFGQQLEEKTK